MGSLKSKLKKSKILFINLSKNYYFPNEKITGQIKLNLKEQLTFTNITLTLNKYEHWENAIFYNDNKDDDNEKKEDNLIRKIHLISLNLQKLLNTNSTSFFLNPGTYNFPFEFPAINFLLPSFEFNQISTCQCYLRYIILGEIFNGFNNNQEIHQTESIIIIKSFSFPLILPLKQTVSASVKKWGLMNKGSTNLTVSIPKNNFCLFDEIPVEITVDNINSKLKVTENKIVLYRKISFFI